MNTVFGKSLGNNKPEQKSSLGKNNTDINTFKDLYEFLQKYPNNTSIVAWLKDPWKGKDKQESLLRLFAGLGLIDKLKNYTMCNGNFNLETIQKISSIKDIFCNHRHKMIKLKDTGDASDLTAVYQNNDKQLLVTTSKNLNKTNVGKLDIDKILTNFQPFKDNGYEMTLCICIRNQNKFNNGFLKKTRQNNIEQTNNKLKELLNKSSTIVLDWNDLDQAYAVFKKDYQNVHIDTILNSNKISLNLKMHQHLGVLKTMKLKQIGNNGNKVLYGHIPRSGKSYIIAGFIF